MREISAESREIDLTMRQWKAAEQTQETASEGMLETLSGALRTSFCIFIAAGVSLATAAYAETPAPTHTSLTVATRAQEAQSQTQPNVRVETVFTAHVTDTAGHALTEESGAGTVSFDTEAASLGSTILDENGEAILAATSLPSPADGSPLAVHAVYHPASAADGVQRTASSVSALTALAVEPDVSGVPNFTITANPASLSVTRGLYGTTAITITPSNGFSEQVTLSCSGLPAQGTCNFSPVIASTANGAFTSTLEIQTQTASGALTPPDFGRGSNVAFAWVLPGFLVLGGFASVRRRRALGTSWNRTGLTLLLIGGCLLGLGGCSSRYGYIHHPPLTSPGTPVGTYAVTINASGNNGSSVTVNNLPLTLQVK